MIAWYIFVLLFSFTHPITAKLPFNLFDCALSGYIKGEMYTDSRQTTSDEEVETSYFPRPQIDDPAGHDINARGSTRMDAFESRVAGAFSGLTMRSAKVSGLVEIDFEIFETPLINIPHLRHAYGKLDWQNFSFLFGQTWHPVVFLEPKTINYNGSAPFDFYARSPQFAFTYHSPKKVDLTVTATSEVDFTSNGPRGFVTDYIRWAMLPNINVLCKWFFHENTMAIQGDFKRIAPRIVSDTGFKVHERLSSFAAVWYVTLKWPSIELNAKVNWGQNAVDYSAIGGYAVKKGSINPISHERDYTNINTVGCWFDIEVIKNKKLKPGVFIGFMHNLGSSQKIDLNNINPENNPINSTIFGFATDVNNVFRISTRITSQIYNLTFAGEVEYTVASYGQITQYAQVINTKPAELIRCTVAAYYFF